MAVFDLARTQITFPFTTCPIVQITIIFLLVSANEESGFSFSAFLCYTGHMNQQVI